MFFVWKGDEGQVGEGCEADRTKRIVIDSITQTIPMNPLGRCVLGERVDAVKS